MTDVPTPQQLLDYYRGALQEEYVVQMIYRKLEEQAIARQVQFRFDQADKQLTD